MSGLVKEISLFPDLGDSNSNNHPAINQDKKRPEAENKSEEASKAVVEQTVRAIEDYVETHQLSLKIQVHKGTGHIMVKVISAKDGKTIREIPPKELLDLAANMKRFEGILFNKTV